MEFSKKELRAYGLGAVGKDMVYALSASYVMYYYQDLLGLAPAFVGLILMIARIFDAANDPFMGVIVTKTKTKFGKYRFWVLLGTLLNAIVLYALFAAPQLSEGGMKVYFAVMYILWGVTYTMMDIPFWSMIPAVTRAPKDRERMSVVGRTCAGVGNALITVFAIKSVALLGKGNDRRGFLLLALIVGVLFVLLEGILVGALQEEDDPAKEETVSIKEMFSALFHNDQAMATVGAILLINCALYITSNLVIYFFKYDLSGETWRDSYTLFTMVGGVSQILGMMVLYPLLRKKLDNTKIFRICLYMAITGYALLLIFCFSPLVHALGALLIPGVLIFCANGILTVLTTVFLSSSVDYGEVQTGHREDAVIFSMQTFVVKAASGIAVFLCGLGLQMIGLKGNADTSGAVVAQSAGSLQGLRLLMTILPMIGLILALVLFIRKFKLTDAEAAKNAKILGERKQNVQG